MSLNFPTDPQLDDEYSFAGKTWIYAGKGWRLKIGGGDVNIVQQSFTATDGQTTFNITDGYTPNLAQVYLNGVKLINGVDVDVSSGTNVVLTVGAEEGDSVDVVAFTALTINNVYTQTQTDALLNQKATTEIYTTTIIGSNGASDWVQASNTDPWIATKNVSGILITDSPTVSLNVSSETFEDGIFLQRVWNLVYRVEASDDDEIKFYAIEEPFANLNVTIQIIR